MFSRMMQTLNATDNLYLTPAQQKDMLDYARSLPKRFAAARVIQDAEPTIIAATLERFGQKQPTLADLAGFGWDTATDDLTLALRAIVQGVLMSDPTMADAKVLTWLRQVLGHWDFSPEAIRQLFESLAETVADVLSPESISLVQPYFGAAIDVIEVSMSDAVGAQN